MSWNFGRWRRFDCHPGATISHMLFVQAHTVSWKLLVPRCSAAAVFRQNITQGSSVAPRHEFVHRKRKELP